MYSSAAGCSMPSWTCRRCQADLRLVVRARRRLAYLLVEQEAARASGDHERAQRCFEDTEAVPLDERAEQVHPVRGLELPGDFETLTLPELLATIGRATHEHPPGTWLRAELSRRSP